MMVESESLNWTLSYVELKCRRQDETEFELANKQVIHCSPNVTNCAPNRKLSKHKLIFSNFVLKLLCEADLYGAKECLSLPKHDLPFCPLI